MIAYLCDSCGQLMDSNKNNGEPINLTLKTDKKSYTVKVVAELDHYHKECVINNLLTSLKEERRHPPELISNLKESSQVPVETPIPIQQQFALGDWKTDTDAKIKLINFYQVDQVYTGIDEHGRNWYFDHKGDSKGAIGKLKNKRRGDELW